MPDGSSSLSDDDDAEAEEDTAKADRRTGRC